MSVRHSIHNRRRGNARTTRHDKSEASLTASISGRFGLNLDGTRDPFEYAAARRLHHCSYQPKDATPRAEWIVPSDVSEHRYVN